MGEPVSQPRQPHLHGFPTFTCGILVLHREPQEVLTPAFRIAHVARLNVKYGQLILVEKILIPSLVSFPLMLRAVHLNGGMDVGEINVYLIWGEKYFDHQLEPHIFKGLNYATMRVAEDCELIYDSFPLIHDRVNTFPSHGSGVQLQPYPQMGQHILCSHGPTISTGAGSG